MPYLEDHTLYYKKSCPYCQKVLRFMQDNKINLDMRDTLQPGNQNDLIHIGGKKQVPCLVIGNKPMYESDDIIAYLRGKAGWARHVAKPKLPSALRRARPNPTCANPQHRQSKTAPPIGRAVVFPWSG